MSDKAIGIGMMLVVLACCSTVFALGIGCVCHQMAWVSVNYGICFIVTGIIGLLSVPFGAYIMKCKGYFR